MTDLPSFEGWTNEEIGAFMKGLSYIEGAETVEEAKQAVAEILASDEKRGLLAQAAESAADTDPTPPGPFGTRTQHLDRMSDYADQKFRAAFGDKAMPVATQVTMDIQPFIDEIYERLRSSQLTITELDLLLRKMTVVTVASTLMAVTKFGAK